MAPREALLRDTDASVGDYDPEPGVVFVATDTGARYVGDGDRWRPLADPGGGAPAARGGTHRAGAVNYEAGYTKPVFHWSFDGGARNNYRYRDVFDDLGLTPTLAISPARLADDGKMSWDELAELQTDHGWGVSNHGHRHDRFDELTPAEQEAEVVEAIDAFGEHGIDHRHYMYSWGMAGGATGRSVVANYYPFAWGTVHAPDTAGIVDVASPYALPRTFVENASEADLAAAVDRAIENETGMVLFGHNVVDGESVDPDGFETDVETIEWLTRYVREQGGEWVDDLDAVVRYAKTPVRVAAGSEPVRIDDVAAERVRTDDVAAEMVRTDDLTADTLTTDSLATDDLTAGGLTAGRLTRADVGATASQSTEQSLPPGERTSLRLDEAGFDHDDAFDPAADGLTVSHSGTYRLLGVVHVRTEAAGTLALRALRDGTTEAVSADTDGIGGVHSRQVEATLELDADETVTLGVEHDTGQSAHTRAGSGRVRLELVRLG